MNTSTVIEASTGFLDRRQGAGGSLWMRFRKRMAARVGSLTDTGYLEERNLLLEYRFAEGKPDRLPQLAADLVRQKRDVIVSLGGDVTPAAQRARRSIPIVMNDAVQAGLGGLARPESNLTGVTLILDTRAGNNCAATRVGILWNLEYAHPEFRQNHLPAQGLGVLLQSVEARRAADLGTAFQPAGRERSGVSSRLMSLQS